MKEMHMFGLLEAFFSATLTDEDRRIFEGAMAKVWETWPTPGECFECGARFYPELLLLPKADSTCCCDCTRDRMMQVSMYRDERRDEPWPVGWKPLRMKNG